MKLFFLLLAFFTFTFSAQIDVKLYDKANSNNYYQEIENIINKSNRFDNSQDMVFWCLKLYAEDVIQERGIVCYDDLMSFGEKFNLYEDINSNKGQKSTFKSKCRGIVNYYINNGYKLSKYQRKLTDEELSMSRSENMTKIRLNIKKENNEKVKRYLTGLFPETLKKPNGKWNVSKISKDLKLSRPTIIRIIEEENL